MPKQITQPISFRINPQGYLICQPNVINSFNHSRQTSLSDEESGGILLGRQFTNNSNVIIDEITTPLIGDSKSRYQYYRSSAHNRTAVEKWHESNGECLYLGLWHTHPEPIPSPSNVDLNDWYKALKHGKFEGNKLFFIIVGTKKTCCWQGNIKSKDKFNLNNNFKKLEMANE